MRTRMEKAVNWSTVIGTLIACIALIVRWLAWQYPKSPPPDQAQEAAALPATPPVSLKAEPTPAATPKEQDSFPSMGAAIRAASKLPYTDGRVKELDRLTRLSLKRGEWESALKAASMIDVTDKKDQALSLVVCYAAQAGAFKVAEAAVQAMPSSKPKEAAILSLTWFATLKPGDWSNENECPHV